MLSLIRDIHADEFEGLIAITQLQSREDIEDYLLARILPSAYTPRAGALPTRYTLDEAERALAYIAWRMNRDHTRDLAWWLIPHWAPALPRVVLTAVHGGVLYGVGFGIVIGLTEEDGIPYGLVFGLAGALVFGLAGVLNYRRRGSGPKRLGGVRWRNLLNRDSLDAGFRIGLPAAVVVGLFFGIAAGLGAGGLRGGLSAGLRWGIGFGGAVGVSLGLASAVASWLGQPSSDSRSPMSPLTSWRGDRTYAFVVGLTASLVAGLALGLPLGVFDAVTRNPESGLETFLGLGLTVGFTAGLAVWLGSSTTWQAALASLQLRQAARTPLRMMRFLEEARSLQVLRAVGPEYQFRHARLQDRLARAHITPNP
jgi:hypothetical protein